MPTNIVSYYGVSRMNRKKLIQIIHVAKNNLNIDTDTYRQMLLTITGVASTSTMKMWQLNRVLGVMKKRGFRIRPPSGSRTTCALSIYPQAKKLRALWLEMHSQGIARDSAEAALQRWVRRETGVDRVAWLTTAQASICIEKLKNWQKRYL